MYVKIDKEPFEVIILTASLKIIGTVHTLPQERLTDFMDGLSSAYVPVTDASISYLSDDRIIAKVKFLSLNKRDVTLISPTSAMVK